MTIHRRYLFCLAAASLLLSVGSRAQSLPAGVGPASGVAPGVGFQLPKLGGGSLQYALNASELVSTGFYGSGTQLTTNLSGDLAYSSRSTSHPFSAIYAGGVLLANSGQPTTVYQSLDLSQMLKTKNWNFEADDAVSYLPESPVSGLSGIPGVGDLGINPFPVGPSTGLGILTTYGPRVSNTASGSASRIISGHLSAQGSGYDTIQRFVGDNSGQAVDNSGEGASVGLSYHFDVRTVITGNYNYSHFSYVGTAFAFSTQGGTLDVFHQWTRRLVTDAYVGPQYVTSTVVGNGSGTTEIAAGANVSYSARAANYALSYSRGVNNGAGVLPGSFANNLSATAARNLSRDWGVSAILSYSKTSSIPALETFAFSSQAVSAGGQATRRLRRDLSAYASYTLEHQSFTSAVRVSNAFSGTYQIFGIGVSYSPTARIFGR